ncbi:GGDEF domain-containing protein [Halobacillus salinus]|uniref:GGDEF domain-containing protein n=1 Tax=Halobacillus salinus TaxID=192814 RepID=UPI0009A78DDE|nr:GGDEF domain-containing protein [Halobacillus salinus]
MEYLVQFQLNVFALLILAVLFIIMRARAKVESFGKKLLRMIMAATAAAIVLEPLTWIFDKKLFPGAYFLEYATNFMLFLIGPILGGLLLSYVDYHHLKTPSRIYKKGFYQHMSVITLLILLINFFYPLYFQVETSTNRYSSGDFKDLHYFVLAGLYIYMLVFVMKNRGKVPSYVSSIFILFFALPIVGMVVQLFESQLYFSWTANVLGILVAYTFLESHSTEQDALTKLYNRQSYEMRLQHLMETKRPFGVVVIDLNGFKQINDQYGHQKGDDLLIEFSRVLRKVFNQDALPARLGGDEFIVIIEEKWKSTETYVEEISRFLKRSNDPLVRDLSFCYGYQCFSEGMSKEELYTTADEKMYKSKRTSKNVL